MTAPLQRRLRQLRYRKKYGHLVWVVGPMAVRRRVISLSPLLALRGRHLYRRNLMTDESFLGCMASPA